MEQSNSFLTFEVGDAVRLIKNFMAYKAGASGVIIKKSSNGVYTVKIQKDRYCKPLNGNVELPLTADYLSEGGCPSLITVSTAIGICNKSRTTIYRYIKKGEIVGFKQENIWVVIEESIKI